MALIEYKEDKINRNKRMCINCEKLKYISEEEDKNYNGYYCPLFKKIKSIKDFCEVEKKFL